MPRFSLFVVGALLVSRAASAQTPVPAAEVTIHASRVTSSMQIDGRLDEPIYAAVVPMTNFLQTEPQPGAVATEKTEVWLLYDDNNVYVSVKCWETHPERRVANDMRRDTSNTTLGNDNVSWLFDTF